MRLMNTPVCQLSRRGAEKSHQNYSGDNATIRTSNSLVTHTFPLVLFSTLAIFALWLSATGAKSLTVDEFDRLSEQNQGDAILTVLEFHYETIRKSNQGNKLLECIKNKNLITTDSGKPYFVNLIILEIEATRRSSAQAPSIEEIVAAVVDRECHP